MKSRPKRKVEQKAEYLTLTKDLASLKIRGARDNFGQVIASFTVRETNGDDETIASQAVKQHGKNSKTTPLEELVKLAILAVNGEEVEQPYDDFDRWNSKARNLAVMAYQQLNGTTPEEMESFLSQGEIEQGDEAFPEDSPSEDASEIA